MAIRNIDVKIRYAYARLRRKVALYFTLWFLALLAGVSLIIDSIFIGENVLSLKIWSAALVVLLAVKLAYDAHANLKREYKSFKEEYNQTDSTLKRL